MMRTEMCMDALEPRAAQVVISVSTLVKFHLPSSVDKHMSQRQKQTIHRGGFIFSVLAALNCAFLITCLFGRKYKDNTTF